MHTLQKTLLLAILATVSACTTVPSQNPATDDLLRGVAGVIRSLQLSLPGTYNNYAQVRSDPDVQQLRLTITSSSDQPRFLVTQTAIRSAQQPREYVWQFGATEDGRLMMDFAPIINGHNGRACRLELLPSGNAIHGSTQAETCQIPNQNDMHLGLMKEYLFNPQRIEIGERLVNLADNQPVGADSKLQFRREISYSGWAGRKNEAGADDDWLLAQPFTMHNQGDVVILHDQLERSFGYRLELAQIVYRQDQPEILRLALIDESSNEQVAFAFSDSNAEQIGLHLGWLQVGLQRIRPNLNTAPAKP